MVGESASVSELLPDIATCIIHGQAIEDVRSLACRGGNDLGCEGRILIRDGAVGLEARSSAVFRIDQVHGLALPRRGEELTVA